MCPNLLSGYMSRQSQAYITRHLGQVGKWVGPHDAGCFGGTFWVLVSVNQGARFPFPLPNTLFWNHTQVYASADHRCGRFHRSEGGVGECRGLGPGGHPLFPPWVVSCV